MTRTAGRRAPRTLALTATAALALAGVAACDDSDGGVDDGAAEETAENGTDDSAAEGAEPPVPGAEGEMPEMPEPDLEGLPDPVAEVNGSEITLEEFAGVYESQFQQAAIEAMMSGQDVDQGPIQEQVLQSMIGNELLFQEASDRGYDISEADVDAELEEIAAGSGVSSEEFLAAMDEQGMDRDQVMDELRTRAAVERLIAEESGDVAPSPDEVRDYYDELVEQYEAAGSEDEIPPFEEAEEIIAQQLTSEREGQAVSEIVEALREDADVTIHI